MRHSKKCFKCGIRKPMSSFYRHPKMADGHVNKCTSCNCADVRKNRFDKVKRYRAYDKQRDQTQHRKAIRKKSNEIYTTRYPEKRRARVLVARALKIGLLHRKSCTVCGSVKTEAHHADYTKPLKVKWLCRTHHVELHRSKK